MHINEKGQTALTLADDLGDIGISSVYQRDTLTWMFNDPTNIYKYIIRTNFFKKWRRDVASRAGS